MSILSEILANKRTEVYCAKKRRPLAELQQHIQHLPPTRDFIGALLAAPRPALIAEVKKASPSKGIIRADFDPVEITRIYDQNGAACISVLTDENYFQGHLAHLCAAREVTDKPLLRKDFLIDEYQLFEARAAGADAVLLIVAALKLMEMQSVLSVAESLGLDVLVEVHNEEELDLALQTSARMIGINNRDLHTFRTTLNVTLEMMPHIPPDRIVVSESGINRREDVQRLAEAGVRAILVGESLMRERDIASKMHELLGSRQPTGV
jgi:indole-3-glycerol phosphate synthase